MQLSDEDRAGLTAEEIAGIESGDDEGVDLDGGDEGDEQAPAPAPAPAPESAENAPAPAPAAAAEPEDDEPAGAKPTAGVVTPAVEKFDETVAQLEADSAAALKKLMDGEITAEEFAVENARVTKTITALRIQQANHEAEVRRSQAQATSEWEWECKRFMRETRKAEGIDYTKDAKLGRELDAQVRTLAADPENRTQAAEWFLEQAHRRVKAIHGVVGKAAAAPTPAPTPAPRTPDLTGIPATLKHVPVAAQPAATDDEFGYMRGLAGDKYEKAIAAMTPEQLDRFMN